MLCENLATKPTRFFYVPNYYNNMDDIKSDTLTAPPARLSPSQPKPVPHCKGCNKPFWREQQSRKYCSQKCYPEYEKKWTPLKLNCIVCNTVFVQNKATHFLCSEQCRIIHYDKFVPSEIICKSCQTSFMPTLRTQLYCTEQCRKLYHRLKRNKRKRECQQPPKEKYIVQSRIVQPKPAFSYLEFKNEEDFSQWFDCNYSLFGVKTIIKHDRFFPDVIARMNDETVLRIELEFHASNFSRHGHDPNGCELIISFVKNYDQETVQGIPVVSIFNVKGHQPPLVTFYPESKSLTSYFCRISNLCSTAISNIVSDNNIKPVPFLHINMEDI